MKTLIESAAAAKAASAEIARLSAEEKNAALLAMADALEAQCAAVLAANRADMDRERAGGMSEDMLDRLMLDEKRVADMAVGLRQVAELPDPVGEVMREWTRPNGLRIKKVRVPMGVIGIIYEARPNVTVDAASLAFKAGSAILLRGSSSAYESNAALVGVMRSALESRGVTPDAVCLVEEKGHDVVDKLLTLRDYVDLIVPRGSARLINNAVENGIEWYGYEYELDSADADKLRELLTDTATVENACPDVINILSEDAAQFFTGQVSARQAAQYTQDRVSTWLSERQ